MPKHGSPTRYRWLVFGLLAGGYLLVYFHRLSPAVVAVDIMRDLQAGGALIGLLGSAYFYPYALMQLPAGLLADYWGPRRTVAIFFLLAGAASIFFSLASSVSGAIIARILVGLGVSMLFVPTTKILTRWFRASEFALMTGLLMAVGGLGVLSASSPLAYMSAVFGWRGSFAAIGVVTLILAVVIWLMVRDNPEDLGYSPVERTSAGASESQTATIPLTAGVKIILGRWAFWPLAIWFFFNSGVYFAFGGLWAGPYLMHVYGLSKAAAGQILAMFAVAMILGSPLVSLCSDRWLRSRKKPIVAASVLLLVLMTVLAFFPVGMSVPVLYGFCFLLALSTSCVAGIAFASVKELFPTAIAGTAMGLLNLFPFLGGAILQPVTGWLLELQGPAGGPYAAAAYGRGFMTLFVSAVLALIAAVLTVETLGLKTAERPTVPDAATSRPAFGGKTS